MKLGGNIMDPANTTNLSWERGWRSQKTLKRHHLLWREAISLHLSPSL